MSNIPLVSLCYDMQDAGRGPKANMRVGDFTALFLWATGLAKPIDS